MERRCNRGYESVSYRVTGIRGLRGIAERLAERNHRRGEGDQVAESFKDRKLVSHQVGLRSRRHRGELGRKVTLEGGKSFSFTYTFHIHSSFLP